MMNQDGKTRAGAEESKKKKKKKKHV